MDNDCTIDIDAILTDKTPWLVRHVATVGAMSSASFPDGQVAATTERTNDMTAKVTFARINLGAFVGLPQRNFVSAL